MGIATYPPVGSPDIPRLPKYLLLGLRTHSAGLAPPLSGMYPASDSEQLHPTQSRYITR